MTGQYQSFIYLNVFSNADHKRQTILLPKHVQFPVLLILDICDCWLIITYCS